MVPCKVRSKERQKDAIGIDLYQISMSFSTTIAVYKNVSLMSSLQFAFPPGNYKKSRRFLLKIDGLFLPFFLSW